MPPAFLRHLPYALCEAAAEQLDSERLLRLTSRDTVDTERTISAAIVRRLFPSVRNTNSLSLSNMLG